MKIQLVSIGKDHEPYIRAGVQEFTGRIGKYFPVAWNLIPVPRQAGLLPETDQKKREGNLILDWLEKEDFLVALDEHGRQFTSEGLASFLGKQAGSGRKRLVFLIGGAFGLDDAVLKRADLTWSLSELTFPHQLVRLLLAEQLYRACTILRNEKYHHK
ncbi:MAG TPA: 23S rRNA (pseudouridine(1915)-N(3))-methyltransferase RlmH [Chitinophagaceae bacterium]|nr:23S rRNA (pseudouridine(1915)-N(3))-methyltransferase RlmH [Chitinophagaceae bacterium]